MKSQFIVIALSVIILAQFGLAAASPIENLVSQRLSIRSFNAQDVSAQQLLNFLGTAYGYAGSQRVVPSIGNAHSLSIFAVNSTGSYLYIPESNSLAVWDNKTNRITIEPDLLQSWQRTANVILIIVWNQTKLNNQYFAAAEAGCIVQNAYLAAANLNLGTTCAAIIDSNGLRSHLKLPTTMVPILVLPLGFPTDNYSSSASPDYSRMHGNLPTVQLSNASFIDALGNMKYTQAWDTQSLSLQEVSQLLWAAYGYSSTGHRTTPSAVAKYPLIVYVSNFTGTYRFVPQTHSVSQIQAADKRASIAAACDNQLWAAEAPSFFLVALDTNQAGNEGITDYGWVEADAGCVIQQILLEASANGLASNVVANGLESWNGAGAQAIQSALGLSASTIPLYVVPVGHPFVAPTPTQSSSSQPTVSPSQTTSPTTTPSESNQQTPTPNPTPQIDEYHVWIVIPIVSAVTIIIIALRRKYR